METNTKITLRDFLDGFGIDSGSDAGFIVVDGNIEMQASYRYLDCPAWKYMLDKFVDTYYTAYNIRGIRVLKIILESEEEL